MVVVWTVNVSANLVMLVLIARAVSYLWDFDWRGTSNGHTTAVTTLSVGQKVTGSLRANEWIYYSFNAVSSSIYVHLREINVDSNGGYIWLFASDDTIPTLK